MIAVDLFCGMGGNSLAIKQVFNAHPIVAVNHNKNAIANHAANFPETEHHQEDVFTVDPVALMLRLGLRRITLLCASPDCRHFSKAKGGKPVDTKTRGLAWVIVKWARACKPEVIFCENVEEFVGWGPLYPDDHADPKLRNKPIPERKGETFRRFVGRLKGLGYSVDWRIIDAADFGTPQHRKRLFLVARRDQQPIRWPSPTHGNAPGLLPYRPAADCMDWSDLGASIFTRRKPLAVATQKRIAEGVRRFVLTTDRPFLLACINGVWRPIDRLRDETKVAAPFLINTRNGERAGQAPRCRSIERPLPTITAQGSQGAMAVAFLAKHNGSGQKWNAAIGSSLHDPIHTITSKDTKALITATLSREENEGTRVSAAFLLKYYSQGAPGSALGEPMHTITTRARMGLVSVEINGETWGIEDLRMRMCWSSELLIGQFGRELAARTKLMGTKTEQIARIGGAVCPLAVGATIGEQFRPAGDGEQLAWAAK